MAAVLEEAQTTDAMITLRNVSKFYGEVLGVNRIDLEIEPGITGLVGPNGAGKSTLMNLCSGLMRPTRGTVSVLGMTLDDAEAVFRHVGYCTQYDAFPPGATGRSFIVGYLRVHGYSKQEAEDLAVDALQRVRLTEAADRAVDGYSKGMRQRIKLAQAFSHNPQVLILDEPLNGLDPLARAEVIELFREFKEQGAHVLVSSHILHEVDLISDRLILLDNGYVVAEGESEGLHGEVQKHVMLLTIRSEGAERIAARVFGIESVIEARLHEDRAGLYVRTSDLDAFHLAFNELVLEENLLVTQIGPADEAVDAVYQQVLVRETVAE